MKKMLTISTFIVFLGAAVFFARQENTLVLKEKSIFNNIENHFICDGEIEVLVKKESDKNKIIISLYGNEMVFDKEDNGNYTSLNTVIYPNENGFIMSGLGENMDCVAIQ